MQYETTILRVNIQLSFNEISTDAMRLLCEHERHFFQCWSSLEDVDPALQQPYTVLAGMT